MARSAGAGAEGGSAPFRSERDMALFRGYHQRHGVEERARRRQIRGVSSPWQIMGVGSDGEMRVHDTRRRYVLPGVSVRCREDRWRAQRWDKERQQQQACARHSNRQQKDFHSARARERGRSIV